MNEEIKDLQKLINERAEDRLNTDINHYLTQITNHSFFQAFNSFEMKDGQIINKAFWASRYGGERMIFKAIKEKFLPKYIEEESKKILRKIDNKDL